MSNDHPILIIKEVLRMHTPCSSYGSYCAPYSYSNLKYMCSYDSYSYSQLILYTAAYRYLYLTLLILTFFVIFVVIKC